MIKGELRIFLKNGEETWRLKSRATWLAEGDRNTKFFHKFATGRRKDNSIWEINLGDRLVHSTEEIKSSAVEYFGTLY